MNKIDLTEENFEMKTANQDGILLFYKTICPFCKILGAVIEKFSKKNPDVNLFQVEFEDQAALSQKLEVERAPTLFILKKGQVAAKKAGLMNPKELTTLWEQN